MRPFSIIVPVYNEELILESSIARLIEELNHETAKKYEIVLSENGSTDNTRSIIERLKKTYPHVRDLHLEKPNFGESIYQGITQARYEKIVVINVDWWDVNFIKQALHLSQKHPLVIGSKHLVKTLDRRPLGRRLASHFLTFLLQKLWGFRGTDTHGLKAIRSKRAITPILKSCVTREIIESELILRAQRQGWSTIEIPVAIEEIRPPRKSLLKRGSRVIKELIILHKNLKHETARR